MNALTQTRTTGLGRNVALALAGAALLTLGAKTQIPFWPVPMTFHMFAVFVIALGMGPRLGLAAMATYLGAGAMGLPVFSGTPERGIGIAYMAGPTGGYLLGHIAAIWLTGTLGRNRGMIGQSLSMALGLAVTYAAGLAWLSVFVPASKLLAVGATPFIAGDLIKLALVAMLFAGWRGFKARQN